MDKLQKLIEDMEMASPRLYPVASYRIIPILKALQELVGATQDVFENGPCSDPDCCELAMKCDQARTRARLAREAALVAIENL